MSPLNQPLRVDACHCNAMRKASRQITRFYDAHLEPAGLRVTQFLTLAALKELGRAAIHPLAERLDIERTAMGKMLGFLERDGLIRLRPSPSDGRSRLIELTDKGRRLHDEASPLWHEAQRQFEQLNGRKDVAALRQGLSRMAVDDMAAKSSDD
ncbi:MarR family transcriptional regulator [Bradyrhizobium genosp. L]|uniref:MarR family winged helix-turn-helix transcriptional regulator n=1 Tax=Bradyrhizobium genosp. L TaxID=83637 RepID=UPI0018A29E72|nr:MarR family transcriptional regulator [Bradyrhizobium genosp. L]QPF87386.1 MarR family transcriptional regulator [Bradyrhizobium genosp. L]